jgi:hypothetical protein
VAAAEARGEAGLIDLTHTEPAHDDATIDSRSR